MNKNPMVESVRRWWIVAVVGLFLTLGAVAHGSVQPWYNAGWQYRKAITINGSQVSGTSTLSSFPILVDITDANIKSAAQTSGNDILFTAGDGVTKLNDELQSYNASTGNLVAWVQVPSLLPSTNTVIYVYYGNPSAANQSNAAATWDSNYKLVSHLGNGTSLSLNDSTANANNGSLLGTAPTASANAQILGSAAFPAANSQIDYGDGASLANPSQMTAEFWVYHSSAPGQNNYAYLSKDGSNGGGNGWTIRLRAGGKWDFQYQWSGGTAAWLATVGPSTGAWQSVALTYNTASTANQPILYINGAPVALSAATPSGSPSSNSSLHLVAGAVVGDTIAAVPGNLEEIRYSSTVRSAGWIQTEYNNESNPSSFYTLAAQETSPSSAPTINSFTASPATITPNQNSTLAWSVSGNPAPTLSISSGVGAVTGTSTVVTPAVTTTYTLTATNALGTSTAQTTVTVQQQQMTATPTISPNGGNFSTAQSITLSDATNGASIYYTLNGLAPTTSSTLYTGSFTATSSLTVNAMAIAPGDTESNVASANFTIGTGIQGSAPSITSFTTSATTTLTSLPVTLSWSVSGSPAPTISINQGIGVMATSTSVSVNPATSTTYTLTATNANGTATALVSVNVVAMLANQSYSSLLPMRQYDLYYPANQTSTHANPIVFFIHGGGWVSGDKTDIWGTPGFPALVNAGYDVYDVNYTLANASDSSTIWPAQEQDLKCFLGYLASGNGMGNPNRISIWGFSAGGHLGLMTGMTNKSQFTGDCEWSSTNYTIQSIVGSSPPTDLLTDTAALSSEEVFLGYPPSQNPAGALAASPVSYVSTSSPAILLEAGTEDPLVGPSQTIELANDFANIGVTIQNDIFNGLGHTLDLDQANGVSVPAAVSFIESTNPATLSGDTTPPIISFTATNGSGQPITTSSTVNGTITFTATSTDPVVAGQTTSGVASIKIFLDGTVVASSTGGNLNYTLNTQNLLDINHSLDAVATDNAGNSASSPIFSLQSTGFSVQWP